MQRIYADGQAVKVLPQIYYLLYFKFCRKILFVETVSRLMMTQLKEGNVLESEMDFLEVDFER